MFQKSCTTWDVNDPINNGTNYLSTGAGFLPSTVVLFECFLKRSEKVELVFVKRIIETSSRHSNLHIEQCQQTCALSHIYRTFRKVARFHHNSMAFHGIEDDSPKPLTNLEPSPQLLVCSLKKNALPNTIA